MFNKVPQDYSFETFYGYVESPTDALFILEACRRGILRKVTTRLGPVQRKLLRSGSIFVFDEKDSGIKRWTDGVHWSPSRVHNGNFLIYRELEKGEEDPSSDKKHHHHESSSRSPDTSHSKGKEKHSSSTTSSLGGAKIPTTIPTEPAFRASLKRSMSLKPKGLIKKSISMSINNRSYHLISYYRKEDIVQGRLPIPSHSSQLQGIKVDPELVTTLARNAMG
ncbi:hypothetical protein HK102_001439, partial [Quaeritorhiza haematococci]